MAFQNAGDAEGSCGRIVAVESLRRSMTRAGADGEATTAVRRLEAADRENSTEREALTPDKSGPFRWPWSKYG